ncbi:hypothetical protein [Paraburkholderia caribensis]|uniref:hypothetical protein n=1 Tax=Paraburkholderia caribensis TaxID=75105 RepID=UPI0034D29C34
MSTFPQAPKSQNLPAQNEPQGVEITHELMQELRASNARYRVRIFGMAAVSRESVLTLLEAFDDLTVIVDDLVSQIEDREVAQ